MEIFLGHQNLPVFLVFLHSSPLTCDQYFMKLFCSCPQGVLLKNSNRDSAVRSWERWLCNSISKQWEHAAWCPAILLRRLPEVQALSPCHPPRACVPGSCPRCHPLRASVPGSHLHSLNPSRSLVLSFTAPPERASPTTLSDTFLLQAGMAN